MVEKSNYWHVVPPIKISGENLVVSLAPNAELKAPFSGAILIKSIDVEKGQILCELLPNKSKVRKGQIQLSHPISIAHPTRSISIPYGYSYFFTEQARSKSYGRTQSDYVYYKRERDLSYLVIVKKNGHERKTYLGSLHDRNSILREALRVFPKGEFFRKDIKTDEMPSGLRHGQKIKAVLDILKKEGFLIREEVKYGRKTIDKFKRTEKTIEELK